MLVRGVMPVRLGTFCWGSQIGMLPATIVYVNAGTQLAAVKSLSGILSPALIGSLVLIGIFPLIAKHAVEVFKARRRLASWPKPKKFERNLVVIGAGSAGPAVASTSAPGEGKGRRFAKDRRAGGWPSPRF